MPKPDDDTFVSDEEMKHRIGTALADVFNTMRWQITGNGNVITITDKWAENEFDLTIERKPSTPNEGESP